MFANFLFVITTFLSLALAAPQAPDNGTKRPADTSVQVDSTTELQATEAARLSAEGEALAKSKDWAKAAEAFERAAARAGGSNLAAASALSRAGQCWMELRDWKKTRDAFASTLSIAGK